MICDCEGAEAVFIQVEPLVNYSPSSQDNHSAGEFLESPAIDLTLKGLNRNTLIRINTAHEQKPFYDGKELQSGPDDLSGH